MKRLLLTVFSLLVFSVIFLANRAEAQSPIRCGLNGEACCNLAGSPPNSCQSGLICSSGTCVSDGTGAPPTRGVVTGDPVPAPGRIPCPDINGKDPNFNSSRPYQASPCGDSPKAVMCGNSLQVIETTPSRRAEAGTQFLDVEMVMPAKTYAADVAGATFPIAGNTELTKNSTSNADQIDDATKVNEYLNWYLNGTTDRAEYGETETGNEVDLAGPVRKLLPGIIQDAQRIVTINNLYKSQDYAAEAPQNPGDHPGPTELVHDKAITHDQIVVCTTNAVRIVPLWLSNILSLPTFGVEKPTECYPKGGGSKATGNVFRLNMWNDQNDIAALWSAASKYLPKIFPGIFSQLIADTANHWPKNYPPLPWSDKDGKPFATEQDYQKAYNEWRGQLCTYIPALFGGEKHLVCAGAWPILSNPYADLYKYVPLSNTVDKSAHTPITGVGINGIGGTEVSLPNIAYNIIQEPVLYYPHTAEVSELSDLLNTTYTPKEGTTRTAPSESTEPVNDPTTNKCRIVNLRSNPGDYLFPEVQPSEVRVDVFEYIVTRIPCHDVQVYNEKRDIVQEYALCQGQVAIEIRMNTKVPYAKEIYDSTTAGADSTFRRIYPKVQAGAPVTCISNIPSVTSVQYIPTENLNGMKVIGPLGDNTTDDPKLYFPHFGSVYDYFLKGIQTALRPKGYGEPTPESGTLCQKSSENFGDICAVADAYGIPCCQLKGVQEIETGGGSNVGGGSCSTKNGSFSCCNGNACGPSQVLCSQYDGFAGNDSIDMCDPVGSAELLARAMLLKLCQAAKQCDTYDWEKEKTKAMKFKVNDGNYTAAAYFYGLNNGCTVDSCTEYRWGPGKTYCDSLELYCKTGNIISSGPFPQFCAACNQELIGVNQTPINCSGR